MCCSLTTEQCACLSSELERLQPDKWEIRNESPNVLVKDQDVPTKSWKPGNQPDSFDAP
jgi:hypothetical protein